MPVLPLVMLRNIIAHFNKPHNHRYHSHVIITVLLVLENNANYRSVRRYGWVLYSKAQYILLYLTVLH